MAYREDFPGEPDSTEPTIEILKVDAPQSEWTAPDAPPRLPFPRTRETFIMPPSRIGFGDERFLGYDTEVQGLPRHPKIEIPPETLRLIGDFMRDRRIGAPGLHDGSWPAGDKPIAANDTFPVRRWNNPSPDVIVPSETWRQLLDLAGPQQEQAAPTGATEPDTPHDQPAEGAAEMHTQPHADYSFDDDSRGRLTNQLGRGQLHEPWRPPFIEVNGGEAERYIAVPPASRLSADQLYLREIDESPAAVHRAPDPETTAPDTRRGWRRGQFSHEYHEEAGLAKYNDGDQQPYGDRATSHAEVLLPWLPARKDNGDRRILPEGRTISPTGKPKEIDPRLAATLRDLGIQMGLTGTPDGLTVSEPGPTPIPELPELDRGEEEA